MKAIVKCLSSSHLQIQILRTLEFITALVKQIQFLFWWNKCSKWILFWNQLHFSRHAEAEIDQYFVFSKVSCVKIS